MLLLALLLGLLIAYPQIRDTMRFYPKSIRRKTTLDEKVKVGSIPPRRILMALISPGWRDCPQGVFYPEATCYIGILGLLLATQYQGWLWVTALFFTTMATGRWLFRLLHRFCLRIPARFLYFLGVTLVLMSVKKLSTLSTELTKVSSHTLFPNTTTAIIIVVLLQAWDLLQNSNLMPMEPYTQRWTKPSLGYRSPVTSYLVTRLNPQSTHRVIGLPYPNQTGQIHHLRTQGYNGGFASYEMPYILGGEQTYDWKDSRMIDWHGIKYAYSLKKLEEPKWRLTEVPNLYENTQVYSVAHEL